MSLKEFIKFYIILDILIILLSIFFGFKWLISSQAAFICTMFIAYTSYRSYTNMIKSELSSGAYDDIDFDDIDDDKSLPKVKRTTNVKAFMSPFKLLAYITLGTSFYLLAKFELINILAFLVGVMPLPIGTMLGAFLGED